MKRFICSLFVAFIAAPIIFGYSLVSAEGVHHPECAGTLIKDQEPHSGFTVTATHAGTMWLKIGPEHVQVSAVSVGETYGPGELSGWPHNTNGKPKEISHVDYCTPLTETTTTWPDTTTSSVPSSSTTSTPSTTSIPPTSTSPTTTSLPPTTSSPSTTSTPVTSSVPTTSLLPAVTVVDCVGICTPATVDRTPKPDACILEDGTELAPGNYVTRDGPITDASTRWSMRPCEPITTTPNTELCIDHDTRETTDDYSIVQDGTANASTTRTYLPCEPNTTPATTTTVAQQTTGKQLAATGSNIQTALTLAVVVVFCGAVLLYVRRRNQ